MRFGKGGTRSLGLLGIVLVLTLLVLLKPADDTWTKAPIVRAQENESYELELQKGRNLLSRRRYEDALKSFK
jgi:hypothetical protein